MSNVTVTVPMDMKNLMDRFDEVNWSAVARNAFAERLEKLQILEEIAAKSKLTEKDALDLGRKVNKSMWEKHYKKLVPRD